MAEEYDPRYRTLGEIVGGVRDNKQLGRVGIAIFPGTERSVYVPVAEEDFQLAGVEPVVGAHFTAEINLDGWTPEEIAPSDVRPLMGDATTADAAEYVNSRLHDS